MLNLLEILSNLCVRSMTQRQPMPGFTISLGGMCAVLVAQDLVPEGDGEIHRQIGRLFATYSLIM
jgi:hypothetical protein